MHGPPKICDTPHSGGIVDGHVFPFFSLPIFHAMAPLSSLPLVSPLETHVLELTGFSSMIRTRDLHLILAPWSYGEPEAYRIKWQDDNTVYILFQDASVAKKVYLSFLCSPPDILRADFNGTELYDATRIPCGRLQSVPYAHIRPLNGPKADALLANANMNVQKNMTTAAALAWPSPPASPSVPDYRRIHRRIVSGTAVPSRTSDPFFHLPTDFPHTGSRRFVSADSSDVLL